MNKRLLRQALFSFIVAGFVGGLFGGFLGMGFLDSVLFGDRRGREVVLQESSIITDVINKVQPSVVSIATETTSQADIFGRRFPTQSSDGTGLIISSDGLILTNKHVVPTNARQIIVSTEGGNEYKAKVIDRDPFNDVAFIKIEATGLTPAELGDSDQVVTGQKVIAIGNALGQFSHTVTSGIISGVGRPIVAQSSQDESSQLQGMFQTDAAINPGNSGGPLVNIEGQVIGINTAVASGAENIGFAIPINQAKQGIVSIQQHGRLRKPYIGARYLTLDNKIAKANDLAVNQGAYIVRNSQSPAILPNSPAEKAGLREGDVIVAVDGKSINERYSLVTLIGQYQVGQEVLLTLIRDGNTMEVKIRLEEVPS